MGREHLPRRGDEGDPGGRPRDRREATGPEEDVPWADRHPVLHLERFGGAAEDLGGGEMTLPEPGGGGPAADRLESEGPGAGEQIEDDGPFDGETEEVEEGLADPLFHRPGARIGGKLEPPAPEGAADDPRRACRLVSGRSRGAAGATGAGGRSVTAAAGSGHAGNQGFPERGTNWYGTRRWCPVPRGPMTRMPLRSLPMVRLVAMFVSNGGMRRAVVASAVTLAALATPAFIPLASAQEPAAEAAADPGAESSQAAADLPPPTREEAEAARIAFAESEQELKKLVGELMTLQQSYQKQGADRPALEATFEAAKTAAQAVSERFEAAALTVTRAGIPQRGEVDNIDMAMPTYQGARKVCAAMVAGLVKTDEPEKALALVDRLERVGAIDGDVLMMAATAAMLVSRLDEADAYLDKLSAVGGSADKQSQIGDMKEKIEDERKKLKEEMTLRAAEAEADDLPRVRIKTSAGDVVVELFENEAPNTVANFLSLAEKGFYNGTPFHRVIPGFMAQGGDPTGRGGGGPGYVIPCETDLPHARKHFRGSLSMAHAGKDTGGSQFFLTFRPTDHLDGKHTVFGRVIEGFDVLPKIHRTQSPDGRPIPGIKPDTILGAEVVRKRDHDYAPKTLPDVK